MNWISARSSRAPRPMKSGNPEPASRAPALQVEDPEGLPEVPVRLEGRGSAGRGSPHVRTTRLASRPRPARRRRGGSAPSRSSSAERLLGGLRGGRRGIHPQREGADLGEQRRRRRRRRASASPTARLFAFSSALSASASAIATRRRSASARSRSSSASSSAPAPRRGQAARAPPRRRRRHGTRGDRARSVGGEAGLEAAVAAVRVDEDPDDHPPVRAVDVQRLELRVVRRR